MSEVRLYTTMVCPYCVRAKMLLRERNIPFTEIDVTGDHDARMRLVQQTGQRTVPQIFIGDRAIGGFTELRELDRSGELARLLAAA